MGEIVLLTPTVLFLNKELILLFYIIYLKALSGGPSRVFSVNQSVRFVFRTCQHIGVEARGHVIS